MTTPPRDEIIEILDCDLGVRPKAAPGVGQLLPHARGVTRTEQALLVDFDDGAAETLEAFVEAERLCCAGIGWHIERSPSLQLRITASVEQLEAIQSLWKNQPDR